jgi:pyridoxamine 5'-phosphate oxidase
MIDLIDIEKTIPFLKFENLYKRALELKQKNIEAICISSFNKKTNEVSSRFVNLKYLRKNEFIFFTNYESKKADDFLTHNQVSGLFFWNVLNVQIRIKFNIKQTEKNFSDVHFKKRSNEKNALAISSMQSKKIASYKNVIEKYNTSFKKISNKTERPLYWGGYTLKPYYFEFWDGHESRINKREVFELHGTEWSSYFLEP